MSGSRTIGIRVLGPLDVRRSGRTVPIPGAKPRAVLTMLALHAGQVVTADVLQAVLWGAAPPRTARKALQTHISALRRALGEPVLRTQGGGWVLATEAAEVTDVAEFEASVHAARDAVREGATSDAIAHFDAAIRIWRGAPELPATTKAQAEVSRWVERHAATVDDQVDALLADGRAAELIGDLESAVADEPLRERRWAQLCLALYRTGRQGDALNAYRRARSVLSDELGVDPGPALRDLESAILTHDPALEATPASPIHEPASRPQEQGQLSSLPVPPTTFVGRRDELATLERLLAEHALVTVVGPGGVGKTRLALAAAVAARAADTFPAGLTFVDLAPTSAEFVTHAVAAAAGIQERPQQPLVESLAELLGRGGRSLLVLDNCEHVLDAAGVLTEALVTACPRLVVLATSRERLSVRGERVFAVPPLSMVGPGTGGSKDSDAATLFLERARAVEPEFDADPRLVAEVCARLDGLPLAIELAAARCGSLGIDGVLTGLDDQMSLLTGARGATERHHSLRAVLDWSYELLDDDERALFRRVGVFAGAFDLAAAIAVGQDAGTSVVDLVGRLTDQSLLVHERAYAGSRWRMLEVVRSYAREKLLSSDEADDVHTRHLRWAMTTAVELERRLETDGKLREAFDAVADDLRAALAATSPRSGDIGERLTLALALARVQTRSGTFTLAQNAYEEAMSLARHTGDVGQLAQAALGASVSGMLFGVTQSRRVALLEEALAARDALPPGTTVRLMARLATELYWSPDRARCHALAEQARALAEQHDDDGARALALQALHYVRRGPEQTPDHLRLPDQVIELAVRAGETETVLAGRAARAVQRLEFGDLAGMDADTTVLADSADHLHHRAFQWYAATFRLVRALIEGRFDDADELASTATESARYAPEFSIGLFFAQTVTDLRPLDEDGRRHTANRLSGMAERFRSVVVWRCLWLLAETELAPAGNGGERAQDLCDELITQQPRDDHWLIGCCLLAEVAAESSDAELARPLAAALRPFAQTLAVAGRVGAFRGSVSYHLGVLAMVLGDVRQAVDDLTESLHRHAGIGARAFEARSLAALGRVFEVRADPADHAEHERVDRRASELAASVGLAANPQWPGLPPRL